MTGDTWLVEGGRIVDLASGRDEVADLYIENGRVATLPDALPVGVPRLDARGLVIAPGFTDLHVHLREPGNEAAETVESGSRAAACGGFTTIVSMPNTNPATDTPALIAQTIERARQAGFVHVLPAGCISRGRAGRELADLPALKQAGAAAFTDDGSTVADDHLMEEAMRRAAALRAPVMDHALDPALAASGVMHEGVFSARLGLPGIPARAESRIVERDIRLCETTGCAIHIQHVSCRDSVDLIRAARRRGLPVSGEATPHHLALCDADVRADDADFKMSPPLGDAQDREALLAAVADGTLQALATDHAPHTAASKARGFLRAPFGIVGLETAIGVTFTALVASGRMTLTEWLRRWTQGPTTVLGAAAPALRPGSPADLVALDLSTEWTVRSERFASQSRNTPFEGRKLRGAAALTICRGRVTWNCLASH